MNYYPNYYPYGNNSGQYMPQTPSYMQPQTQQPQLLNGKIVDSEDVVKVTEVPIGSYGIFPKADLSEIYVKAWNGNGTTNIFTFKPDAPIEVKEEANTSDTITEILNKINSLEAKIDSLNFATSASEQPKKEVKINREY